MSDDRSKVGIGSARRKEGRRPGAKAVRKALAGLVVAGLMMGFRGAVRRGPPEGAGSVASASALDTIASGLVAPWAMDFAPDGRVFVTERPGRIRVIRDGTLEPEPWARVNVVPESLHSEGGLMGIAVAPDFSRTGHVFVDATVDVGGKFVDRIIRFTERDGRGTDPVVVVDGLPGPEAVQGTERALHTHVGGALIFGSDGDLYVTTGDATGPDSAQSRSSLAGKVLRFRADGSIPDDNPIPGTPIFALGIRNSQGLALLPDGRIAATDHGPSELSWEHYRGWFGDELNVIVPGGNYGWPLVAGSEGNPEKTFLPPLRDWSPSIAPSGVAFRPVESGGEIFVASLRGEAVHRLRVEKAPRTPAGWTVTSESLVLQHAVGRIRAVRIGPDGRLYFTSSNRDGRGQPSPGDDHVFRMSLND